VGRLKRLALDVGFAVLVGLGWFVLLLVINWVLPSGWWLPEGPIR
jgi:hypothetical protein